MASAWNVHLEQFCSETEEDETVKHMVGSIKASDGAGFSLLHAAVAVADASLVDGEAAEARCGPESKRWIWIRYIHGIEEHANDSDSLDVRGAEVQGKVSSQLGSGGIVSPVPPRVDSKASPARPEALACDTSSSVAAASNHSHDPNDSPELPLLADKDWMVPTNKMKTCIFFNRSLGCWHRHECRNRHVRFLLSSALTAKEIQFPAIQHASTGKELAYCGGKCFRQVMKTQEKKQFSPVCRGWREIPPE